MKDPVNGDTLARLMLCALLYRLGGEQSFTAEELNEIQEVVGGVQFFLTDDNRLVVQTRNPDATLEAAREGRGI